MTTTTATKKKTEGRKTVRNLATRFYRQSRGNLQTAIGRYKTYVRRHPALLTYLADHAIEQLIYNAQVTANAAIERVAMERTSATARVRIEEARERGRTQFSDRAVAKAQRVLSLGRGLLQRALPNGITIENATRVALREAAASLTGRGNNMVEDGAALGAIARLLPNDTTTVKQAGITETQVENIWRRTHTLTSPVGDR